MPAAARYATVSWTGSFLEVAALQRWRVVIDGEGVSGTLSAMVGLLRLFPGARYSPVTGWVTATANATGLVTLTEYDGPTNLHAGLVKSTTNPLGKKAYFDYNNRGQLTRTWGDVPGV